MNGASHVVMTVELSQRERLTHRHRRAHRCRIRHIHSSSTHADWQGVDRLFTVCVSVCTVTDFSTKDKANSIKLCTVVHRRPGQEIHDWHSLRKSDHSCRRVQRPASALASAHVARALADTLATRRIGRCGYTAIPEDARTC